MLSSDFSKVFTLLIQVEPIKSLWFLGLLRLKPVKIVRLSALFVPLLAAPLGVQSGHQGAHAGPLRHIYCKYLLDLHYSLLTVSHDSDKLKCFKFSEVRLIKLNWVEVVVPTLHHQGRRCQVNGLWRQDLSCILVFSNEYHACDT